MPDLSDAVGILPDFAIEALIEGGAIPLARTLDPDQVQPASLDLRLGETAFRVRASFLPGERHRVSDRLAELTLHAFSLEQGAVLETGCVYIVPLLEAVRLPAFLSASANPKSSTGRLDVFTRVITDFGISFDTIPPGYEGPLYLEISPRTFPVLVRSGSRLSQIRFRVGQPRLTDDRLRQLDQETPLVEELPAKIDGGLGISIDLTGMGGGDVVGFRAKRHTGVIDMDAKSGQDVDDFWEPVSHNRDGAFILDPDEFYILVSKEAVQVPPDYAAEMLPVDTLVGEFRVHYAGFFDPGFGYKPAGGSGARAVLEVRSRDVPFIVEDGQTVGKLVYERMQARPKTIYGIDIGSNYQAQGLKLSKHFRPWQRLAGKG